MNQLIIKGGLLIDGTGRSPMGNGVVRIEGDRIAAVGQEKEIDMPAGSRVIDFGIKF